MIRLGTMQNQLRGRYDRNHSPAFRANPHWPNTGWWQDAKQKVSVLHATRFMVRPAILDRHQCSSCLPDSRNDVRIVIEPRATCIESLRAPPGEKGPAATVMLHIEALRADQQRQLDRILRWLGPPFFYADRVSVWTVERVRPVVPIDSSVFHLLLAHDRHTNLPPA